MQKITREPKQTGALQLSHSIIPGGTITKVADNDIVGAGHFEAVRGSRSLWNLGGQRRRNGVVVELLAAVVDWHLAALAQVISVAAALVTTKNSTAHKS